MNLAKQDDEDARDPKKKKKLQLSEFSVAGTILKNSKKNAIQQVDEKRRINYESKYNPDEIFEQED